MREALEPDWALGLPWNQWSGTWNQGIEQHPSVRDKVKANIYYLQHEITYGYISIGISKNIMNLHKPQNKQIEHPPKDND